MNADELKKADEIVRALRCNDAPVEPDGMGCANKKCRYRDVDGACDIVSMCEDAAALIDSLTAQLAEVKRQAAEIVSVTADRDAARERLCYTCNNGNHSAREKHSTSCDICL